jgi:hypothetical protein
MELVPIPAVLSAPYAGVQLSEEAARAPGRGLQQAGRSIMEVGGQMEELGQRMQQAKDNVDLLKAQLAIDAAKAEEDEWRTVNQDESLWEGRSRETVAKAKKAVSDLKLSRSATDRLMPTMMEFEQKHPTTVKYAAMQKRVKSLAQTRISLARDLSERGDLEKADSVLAEGVAEGTIGRDVAALEQQSNGRIATVANVQRMVRAGAAGADEAAKMLNETDKDGNYVNYPDTLSEADRTVLSNSAANAAAHYREMRGQEHDKVIYEAKASGNTGLLVGLDTRLDMDVKEGRLLASQARNIKRLAEDGWNPAEVQIRSVALMEMVRKLNPADTAAWDAGITAVRLHSSGFPDGARKSIEEAITRQQKVASTGATKLPAGVSAEEKLTRVRDSDGFGPYVGLAKPQYEVEMQNVTEWKLGWKRLMNNMIPVYPTAKQEIVGQKPVLTDKGLPQFVRNADTGEPIIDPKKMAKQAAKREKAEAAHAQAQLALQAWRKQNPTANEAEALKWVDDYLVARAEDTYGDDPEADPTAH